MTIKRLDGHECIFFPNRYTILDLETTGLDCEKDFIIEIAAIKIQNGREISHFETLLRPPVNISEQVQNLTGISDDLVKDSPVFSDIASPLFDFLQDEVIIGHCIFFDLAFLSNALQKVGLPILENDYVDTLTLSRKLFTELIHHRLCDMAAYYKIDNQKAHRAMADCIMNYQVFEKMKETVLAAYKSYESFLERADTIGRKLHARDIQPSCEVINREHPLYQKSCAITGALSKYSRAEAMQKIADVGGINMDKVNTDTKYLILGTSSYCDLITGNTSKQKKALRLIDEGYPLKIITEEEFHQMFT